jgi:hypothetical protein
VKTRLVLAGTAVALAAAAVPAVLLLSTRASNGPGPLGGGSLDAQACFPVQHAGSVAQDDFMNKTTAPIRVLKLDLIHAHGVRLTGVNLVPILSARGGWDLLTTGGPYPPTRSSLTATPDAHWNDRRTLPMTMSPDQSGHSWNLVFGVERTAPTGTAGYQLEYEWKGNRYIWSSRVALKLVSESCIPDHS